MAIPDSKSLVQFGVFFKLESYRCPSVDERSDRIPDAVKPFDFISANQFQAVVQDGC